MESSPWTAMKLTIHTRFVFLFLNWSFMDGISLCSQKPKGFGFGRLRIPSLLFADKVVLLASSSHDLQPSLKRFAVQYEAAGVRVSTSKFKAKVLCRIKVESPIQVRKDSFSQAGGSLSILVCSFEVRGKMKRDIDWQVSAGSAVEQRFLQLVVVKRDFSKET